VTRFPECRTGTGGYRVVNGVAGLEKVDGDDDAVPSASPQQEHLS
jgi:hypothetical protein